MKKICLITQDPLVKGGIAAVVEGYHGSFLEKKYEIIYIESYTEGSKLRKLLKALSGYIHFIKILVIENPDLIHIHSSFGASFYRKIPFIYIASWAKKPIINHIHGADFDKFYCNATKRKKEKIKKVYSKCSALIALSDEWKKMLSMIVPIKKIFVVENYSTLHQDALEQRIARNVNNIVLFLGEIGKRKGCYDIPSVCKQVIACVPNVQFILAGAGTSEDENAIKTIIKDNGLEDHVLFPGWLRGASKDNLLRIADIFFLPSYNEGMPMSILDAMGYGLPIVSTNVGGIPQIVQNGRNGICCEPGNSKVFAREITKILLNTEIRKQYSIESFNIAYKKYSLDKHLNALDRLYNLLVT